MRTLRGSVEQVLAQGRELGDDYLRVLLDEPPRPGLADEVRQAAPPGGRRQHRPPTTTATTT